MRYSVLKYGHLMLTDVEDFEQAKNKALVFVTSKECDFIEVRRSDEQTVTIGYFDGWRFHWTKDRSRTEAWKGQSFVTRPPLWRSDSKSKERR